MPASQCRTRRTELGLSQAELAARARVSRQLVAAVEAGRHTPAVDAAIRLAAALSTSAEALFAPPAAKITAALGDPLRSGALVRLGRVGDRIVAAELSDGGAAGVAPDGVIEQGQATMFTGGGPAGTVLAGCDPALGIVQALLPDRGPERLLSIPASTGTALTALARGDLHAAVVHGPDGSLPAAPVAVCRWRLARWNVGLAIGRKLDRSLEAILSGPGQVVQREPGAASQQALQRAVDGAELGAMPAGPRVSSHLDAARAAALLGCAGVTTEAAARLFGLRFVALEEHTVETWVDRRWRDLPGILALGELFCSSAFTDRAAGLGGYDLRGCGQEVAA